MLRGDGEWDDADERADAVEWELVVAGREAMQRAWANAERAAVWDVEESAEMDLDGGDSDAVASVAVVLGLADLDGADLEGVVSDVSDAVALADLDASVDLVVVSGLVASVGGV